MKFRLYLIYHSVTSQIPLTPRNSVMPTSDHLASFCSNIIEQCLLFIRHWVGHITCVYFSIIPLYCYHHIGFLLIIPQILTQQPQSHQMAIHQPFLLSSRHFHKYRHKVTLTTFKSFLGYHLFNEHTGLPPRPPHSQTSRYCSSYPFYIFQFVSSANTSSLPYLLGLLFIAFPFRT